MNRAELLACLDEASIDARSYDLDEGGRSESYVLRERDGRWEVFYSERGLRSGLRCYSSESEASAYFFKLVSTDPATRRR